MAFQEALGRLFDIKAGIIPLDLQTARTGDYVSLRNCGGCAIVIFKGIGTAAQDPVFTLNKAKTVAAGSTTTAAVIDTIYQQQGATALSAVTGWTKVTQAAGATWTADATSAESEGLYVIHVNPEALGEYDCISVDVADVGNAAQLGCVLYILYDLKAKASPDALPDPLVD